ncbi:MAG: hypothetical protein P3B98_10000 [Gemmatimonadota bacterium]|nr:hypothetical protein [Gemmatimonadota bacterium]
MDSSGETADDRRRIMKTSFQALLAARIDYAGLFPPAALSMDDAVANYAAYRASDDAWALARLIVPAVRLEEFEAAFASVITAAVGTPWSIAALAQASDADAMRAFNARQRARAGIDTVESRAVCVDDIEALTPLTALGAVYVEVPIHEDPEPLIAALAARGLRAKVRTGGVTSSAFPQAAEVARFLLACARHEVPCKATAGLHHPLRGEYPLTYDAGAARGTMFGYLNVLLAASWARRGLTHAALTALLEERAPAALQADDAAIVWRGHTLRVDDLIADQARAAVSFGSCSFREPLDDLPGLFPS